MYIQHTLSYAVRNFHLNWLTFLEAMTDVLGVHFLSGHSVVALMKQWIISQCLSGPTLPYASSELFVCFRWHTHTYMEAFSLF